MQGRDTPVSVGEVVQAQAIPDRQPTTATTPGTTDNDIFVIESPESPDQFLRRLARSAKRKRIYSPGTENTDIRTSDISDTAISKTKAILDAFTEVAKLCETLSKNVDRNTKREIKDISIKLKRKTAQLNKIEMWDWLEEIVDGVIQTWKKPIPTAQQSTQTELAKVTKKETRSFGTQTGEESTLEEIPDDSSYTNFESIADMQWTDDIFKNVDIVVGNPLDSAETFKVVLVEKDDPDMSEGIQLLYKKRFPGIAELEDMDILEQTTTFKTKTGKHNLLTKVMKICVSDEETTFRKLTKLAEETSEEKEVVVHHMNGVSIERQKKLYQTVFRKSNSKVHIHTTTRKMQTEANTKGTKKNTLNPDRRTYAIVVDSKNDIKATIEGIKTGLKDNKSRESIRTIRTNKEGKLIIAMDTSKEALREIGEDIERIMGKENVRMIGDRKEMTTIFIRGIDPTATKEDVKSAIQEKITEMKDEDIKIGELRPYAMHAQATTVRINTGYAQNLLSNPDIRIGLVRCKIEEKIKLDRCSRCWSYENHSMEKCKGPDRRQKCFRCGKDGHLAKDCKDQTEECLVCQEKGHIMGSGKCTAFKSALNAARTKVRKETRPYSRQNTVQDPQ